MTLCRPGTLRTRGGRAETGSDTAGGGGSGPPRDSCRATPREPAGPSRCGPEPFPSAPSACLSLTPIHPRCALQFFHSTPSVHQSHSAPPVPPRSAQHVPRPLPICTHLMFARSPTVQSPQLLSPRCPLSPKSQSPSMTVLSLTLSATQTHPSPSPWL